MLHVSQSFNILKNLDQISAIQYFYCAHTCSRLCVPTHPRQNSMFIYTRMAKRDLWSHQWPPSCFLIALELSNLNFDPILIVELFQYNSLYRANLVCPRLLDKYTCICIACSRVSEAPQQGELCVYAILELAQRLQKPTCGVT